jgi:hypothetical protein
MLRFNFDAVKIEVVPDVKNLDAYLNEDHGHPTIARVERILRQDAKAELDELFAFASESWDGSDPDNAIIDSLGKRVRRVKALIDASPKLMHRQIVTLLEDRSQGRRNELPLTE